MARLHRFELAISVGAGLIWTAPAMAQQSPTSVQEIVVTANRVRENIQLVPMAANAFTGQDLSRFGLGDASDLSRAVPGLTYARSGSNTPIYTIRGVGFDTRNISASSPVGMDVNEVAYAYPYLGGAPFFDVDEAQVLKGPQGTLFGRNTTGGLIAITTVRPGKTPTGYLLGSFGAYETYQAQGAYGGPLSDSWGARLAFDAEGEGEGWQRSVSRDERLGKKAEQAARLSLDWQPTPALRSELTLGYWRNRSDTQAPQAVFLRADFPQLLPPGIQSEVLTSPTARDADWDPAQAGKPPFRTRADLYTLSERLAYDVGPRDEIISVTGYNLLRRNDFDEMDGTRYEFNAYNSVSRISSISEEVRWDGERGPLRYIFGGYYAHDSIADSEIGWVDDATTILALRSIASQIPQSAYSPAQIQSGFRNFSDRSHQDSDTASLFGNLRYRTTERLELDAGARLSRDHLAYAGCSYDYQGDAEPIWNTAIAYLTGSPSLVAPGTCLTYKPGYTGHDAPDFRSTLSEGNVSFRVSASWTPSSWSLLYASISQGYKSGAYPLIPANIDTQLTPARQEKVIAYEAGAKSTLLQGRLQLRATGFYYDYDDKQTYGAIPDPVFVTLNRIINIPKSRVYGIEGEIDWQATRELSLDISATRLNSQVLDYLGYDLAGQPEDFAGRQFTFTPKFQLSASVVFDRPITSRLGVNAALHLSYQSRSFGDLENSAPYVLRGYALLNAEVGLYSKPAGWQVSLWASNLTDTYYWTYTGYERETAYRLAGMPRTFGIRVREDFR